MISWVKNRISERTTWDGAMVIALGLLVLFLTPLAKIAAGSAINRDVPPESLAIARQIQHNKIGLAKKIMLKLQKVADKIRR